jgi:hypothetical protein
VPVWRAEKGHLFGGSKIGRYHPDQREPNAGSCGRLRINNTILDKCNISHVPNILRFTIAMVVIHSQRTSTEQLRMKRGDEPGANFGKKGSGRTVDYWCQLGSYDKRLGSHVATRPFKSVRQTIFRRCTELIDWQGSCGHPSRRLTVPSGAEVRLTNPGIC